MIFAGSKVLMRVMAIACVLVARLAQQELDDIGRTKPITRGINGLQNQPREVRPVDLVRCIEAKVTVSAWG